MNLYEGVYEDGILFGVWDGGPWAAYKYAQKPAMSWLSGGTHHFDLMVHYNKLDWQSIWSSTDSHSSSTIILIV